ncbi:hypothetical protein JCM8208_007466 [Rhodotorula glutinis]
MSSEQQEKCLVCGAETKNRCSSCPEAGVDRRFCSSDPAATYGPFGMNQPVTPATRATAQLPQRALAQSQELMPLFEHLQSLDKDELIATMAALPGLVAGELARRPPPAPSPPLANPPSPFPPLADSDQPAHSYGSRQQYRTFDDFMAPHRNILRHDTPSVIPPPVAPPSSSSVSHRPTPPSREYDLQQPPHRQQEQQQPYRPSQQQQPMQYSRSFDEGSQRAPSPSRSEVSGRPFSPDWNEGAERSPTSSRDTRRRESPSSRWSSGSTSGAASAGGR